VKKGRPGPPGELAKKKEGKGGPVLGVKRKAYLFRVILT